MKVFKGKMTADGIRFRIVCSRFNELITRQLLEGAIDTLIRHGASESDIEITWVPGAFEVPYAAMKHAKKKGGGRCNMSGRRHKGRNPPF